MKLHRNIRLSVRALFSHRLRATLAVTSVAVGVAAVTVTSAIGVGAQRSVQRSIASAGVNLLVVRPAEVKRFSGRRELGGSNTTLRLEDYSEIVASPLVAKAAAAIDGAVKAKVAAATTSTTLRGTTPAYPIIRRFNVAAGRFFDDGDDVDARRVAVLGARVTTALFGDDDAVGREIRVRGVPFEVIGVLAAKGALADGDEDNQVLVPVRTALRRVFNVEWLSAVFVTVRDADAMTDAERTLTTLLERSHRRGRDGRPDFEIQNAARFYTMQKRTADSLTTLAAGLAGISLAVGGVGIMGLMLLSVKERTSEIGLRMAVGATPRDVLLQFLLEASALSFGGWTVGLLLGGVGAVVITRATGWEVAAPAEAIAASFAIAALIGLGFGSVPARKASMVPPLRALVSR